MGQGASVFKGLYFEGVGKTLESGRASPTFEKSIVARVWEPHFVPSVTPNVSGFPYVSVGGSPAVPCEGPSSKPSQLPYV